MSGPACHADAHTLRERILVVCTRYIGDTLLAVPFLRNLRRAYPHAVIDVCAEGGARAVLASCPHVDELLAWTRPPRQRRRGITGAISALAAEGAWLRSRRYARAYLLKPSLSAAVLATLAGIPVRVGFSGESSPLLTRRVRRRPGRHQVETYLDLLRAEGHAIDDGRNEHWVAPAAAKRVRPLLEGLPAGRPRVLIAPRSTDVKKHWHPDRWRRLVDWLVRERGCEIVFCGGPADVIDHEALRESLAGDVALHVHDFSEAVPLADVAAFASRIDLCVGVDTGLVHLAASVGMPVVVLYGPTDPDRWVPWRTRATILRSTAARRSLGTRLFAAVGRTPAAGLPGHGAVDDIPYEAVAASVEALLPARPAMRSLDLTRGSFRYEVVAAPVASSPAAAPPVDVAAAD
jgi:heptosyltransferase II